MNDAAITLACRFTPGRSTPRNKDTEGFKRTVKSIKLATDTRQISFQIACFACIEVAKASVAASMPYMQKSIGEAWVVDFELTQEEVNDFISIQKRSLATDPVFIPLSGRVEVPLSDLSGSVEFQLDVRRARIDLKKGTNQTRLRKTIVLVRLDYGGAPHRNPDGEEVPCPHIHIYKPGYGDKWARSISDREFKNIGDFWQTLDDFMTFCNITDRPIFQGALFDD